jgi:hypothetical protein
MKNCTYYLTAGVLLIITAITLASTPVYTSIKEYVVDAGGSIGVAVGVAWTLVGLVLVGGILLVRRRAE